MTKETIQSDFDPTEHSHRRRNPLTGEWVIVSPHRMKRPWQGQVEKAPSDTRPAYDAQCYLCPGNERAGGATQNPQYETTFVFENDFAALLNETPPVADMPNDLFQIQAQTGICRVMCFNPRHDLTLPEMTVPEIRAVVDMWSEQVIDLGNRPEISYVQLFENKGAMMGCSNPHPHGQVWGCGSLPEEAEKEEASQRAYYVRTGSPMLVDYLAAEVEAQERIVVANEHWVCLVPYWALWPFETMLLPRRHVTQMPDLTTAERDGLADILKRSLIRYDNLFETSFPYSMGWHGRPTTDSTRGGDFAHWQLHAHFYPPLLRSATVKKFMVGFEMLGTPQRDLTAEQAAAQLRALSEVHYKHK